MRNIGFKTISGPMVQAAIAAIYSRNSFVGPGKTILLLAVMLSIPTSLTTGTALAVGVSNQNHLPIMERNIDVSRKRSTKRPRNVNDQAIVNGWPLYRTNRGQEAFNHAMATLQVTDSPAPDKAAFKGCSDLGCHLLLPKIDRDGWLPSGRIWISPSQYVLITHSPRRSRKKKIRRNSLKRMKYFVFHEFQNSTHNTDPYDTISAHKFSVFVPFYMGKRRVDARGNRFVVIVQVSPYDVRSIHASNKGNAGPGIEVAKNTAGKLEPLQGAAGILIATMVKKRLPKLRVVNHRGNEGRPMLRAYKKRLALLKRRPSAPTVRLPFVPAKPMSMALVSGRLGELIARPGNSPVGRTRLAYYKSPKPGLAKDVLVEKNTLVARDDSIAKHLRALENVEMQKASISSTPGMPVKWGMSPLAIYLKANLTLMQQTRHFAKFIPPSVAAVLEDGHEPGIVYLLDARHNVLGKIHAHSQNGSIVRDNYVYVPINQTDASETLFKLKIQNPEAKQLASLSSARSPHQTPKLLAPPSLVTQPTSPPEPMLIEAPRLVNAFSNNIGG